MSLELGKVGESEGDGEAEFICQVVCSLGAMGRSSGFFVFFFNCSGNVLEIYHLVCSYESPFPKAYMLRFLCDQCKLFFSWLHSL